ncbi:MAG TPA: flavin reductase family protein [Burkholderiales bacterium]
MRVGSPISWNVLDAGRCDPRRLRRAFAAYGTGVAVVGAVSESGARVGMTINSFSSVSLSPPLVMFCPSKSLAGYDVYRQAPHFSVSILREDQVATAERFARPRPDKWDGVDYELTANGVPMLGVAVATFECRTYARHEAGDHLIVLGEVLRCRVDDAAPDPLLFYASRYAAVRQTSEPDPLVYAHLAGWAA